MSKDNNSTTGNLLHYDYFPNYYKLIAIDLSKHTELENLDLKQEFNFFDKIKEDNGAAMFFIIKKIRRNNF